MKKLNYFFIEVVSALNYVTKPGTSYRSLSPRGANPNSAPIYVIPYPDVMLSMCKSYAKHDLPSSKHNLSCEGKP